jgi:ELWxxDGT repeat protein
MRRYSAYLFWLASVALCAAFSARAVEPEVLVSAGKHTPGRETAVTGGFYYFYLPDVPGGLWRSDGTPEGTHQLFDESDGWVARMAGGENLFFFAVDALSQPEDALYVVDEDADEPRWLAPITVGQPFALAVSGDRCFWHTIVGNELHLGVSDGSTAGTKLLRSFTYPPDWEPHFYLAPWPIAAVEGGVVFSAPHPEASIELWFSNGMEAGTYLIADLCEAPPGPPLTSVLLSSMPAFMTAQDGYVYFEARNAQFGCPSWSTWRTDGTAEGTIPFVPLGAMLDGNMFFMEAGQLHHAPGGVPEFSTCERFGVSLSLQPYALVTVGSYVYFAAREETGGAKLWRTGGGCDDVTLVADLHPGGEDGAHFGVDLSRPHEAHQEDYLYFYGNDELHGWEVWRAGGDPPVAERLTDINPGPADTGDWSWTHAPPMVILGNRLLFWGKDTSHHTTLWSLEIPPTQHEVGPCSRVGRGLYEANEHACLRVPGVFPTGTPFQWYRDGVPLSGPRYEGANGPLLRIPYVQQADTGVYTCIHGSDGASYTTTLTVADSLPISGMPGLGLLLGAMAGLTIRRSRKREHAQNG